MASRGDSIATWNLGTGRGYSVLDMVRAFERVNSVSVPYRLSERLRGDVAACFASPEKAKTDLGWEAALGLDEMCASIWQFERALATRNAPRLDNVDVRCESAWNIDPC